MAQVAQAPTLGRSRKRPRLRARSYQQPASEAACGYDSRLKLLRIEPKRYVVPNSGGTGLPSLMG
jgi:hypothetical protein